MTELQTDNCPDCPHSYYLHPLKGNPDASQGSSCTVRGCQCTNIRVPMPLPGDK